MEVLLHRRGAKALTIVDRESSRSWPLTRSRGETCHNWKVVVARSCIVPTVKRLGGDCGPRPVVAGENVVDAMGLVDIRDARDTR